MDVLVDEGSELQSSDPYKQINALVRILQLLTRGDQRILINVLSLSKFTLLSDNRAVRLLTYQILRRATTTEGRWTAALPIILKDLTSDDFELQIGALRLIEVFPPLVLMEVKDRVPIAAFLRHPLVPVRRATVHLLRTVCLYNHFSPHPSFGPFLETNLNLLRDLLFEETDHVVFNDILRLFNSFFIEFGSNPSSATNLQLDGRTAWADLYGSIASNLGCYLLQYLFPLMQRMKRLLLPQLRSAGIGLITQLLLKYLGNVQQEPKKFPMLYGVSPYQLVRTIIENDFQPMLVYDSVYLRYEVTKGMLQLALSPFSRLPAVIDAAATAALGLLMNNREEFSSCTRFDLLKEMLVALPRVDLSLVPPMAMQLIRATHKLTDLSQRLTCLTSIFRSLYTTNQMKARGATSFLEYLFKDEFVAAEWTKDDPFRAELLFAMIEATRAFDTPAIPLSLKNDAILEVLSRVSSALQWDFESPAYGYAMEAHLRLLYATLSQPPSSDVEKVDQVSLRLADQVASIKSDQLCIQVILLLCRVLPDVNLVKDGSKSEELLRVLLTRFVPSSSYWKDHRIKLAKTYFEGQLLASTEPDPLPLQLMPQTLEALQVLGLRSSYTFQICSVLSEIVSVYRDHASIVVRASQIQQQLKKFKDQSKAFFSTESANSYQLVPALENFQELFDKSSARDVYLITAMKCSAGLADMQQLTEHYIRFQRTPKHAMVQISGPSDPLVISIGHLVNPHLRRVTVFLNVTNLTTAELKNVGLSFGLAGQIELPPSKAVPFLKLSNLAADSTGQLELSFGVQGFGAHSLTARVYISARDLEELSSADGYAAAQLIHCVPYHLDINEFLLPAAMSSAQFLHLFNRMSSRRIFDLSLAAGKKLAELTSGLSRYPFARIFSKQYGTKNFFQAAFAAITWFDDLLLLEMCATLDAKSQQWNVRMEFRSSSEDIVEALQERSAQWFSGLGAFVHLLLDANRDRVLFNETGKEISTLPQLMYNTTDLLKRWKAVKDGAAI